ncbi:uncharacterized protein DDB_G0271670-like isoform X2 [Macrobrachium nipponense]
MTAFGKPPTKMEEKVVGGKEKKYVLYTVVGEERGRAGAGVWVVRVLLGTLLLVALAVVPYLSLRLAQVSDRTLVVFQPVPIRNHSLHQHNGDHHVIEHGKLGHVDVVSVLQSAALTRENYTAEHNNVTKSQPLKSNSSKASSGSSSSSKSSSSSSSSNSNSSSSSHHASTNSNNNNTGSIVTLHESAVTLAVMEDTNATRKKENNTDGDDNDHEEGNSEKAAGLDEEKKEAEENTTTEDTAGTSEAPASVAQVALKAVDASPSTPQATVDNTTTTTNTTEAPHHDSNATSVTPAASTAAAVSASPSSATVSQASETGDKEPTVKTSNVSTSSSTVAPNTTTTTTTSTTTSTRHPLSHKLVYVATTASGNHVGGFCVWKTDKNITRWSYFYENIPIEYQSHSDSSDHEMRGMLAAVRTWAPLWNDHHVVLRSHHPSIKGSDHPTRRALTRELEKLSEGRFSYELEWRLRKTDRVVDIAYCLSRLHRDYVQWYRTFQARVDELLGQQNWTIARTKNRAAVSQDAFLTDDPEDEGVIIPGDK